MQPLYRIYQTKTGVELFAKQCDTKDDVLNAMAREAGYESYASMPGEVGNLDELLIEAD